MSTLNVLQIISGNFSPKGNYSAYDDDNERYFVSKRMMESQGWVKDSDVVFPFWAKTKVKAIGQLDANGDPLLHEDGTPVTVERPQVSAIFKTRQALIDNCVDKASLPMDIQVAIRDRATTAGLAQKDVDALVNAII